MVLANSARRRNPLPRSAAPAEELDVVQPPLDCSFFFFAFGASSSSSPEEGALGSPLRSGLSFASSGFEGSEEGGGLLPLLPLSLFSPASMLAPLSTEPASLPASTVASAPASFL